LKRFADAIVRFREMTPEAREEAKPRRDEQIRRTKEKLDEGQPAASGLEDRADPLSREAPPPPPSLPFPLPLTLLYSLCPAPPPSLPFPLPLTLLYCSPAPLRALGAWITLASFHGVSHLFRIRRSVQVCRGWTECPSL